VAVRGRMCCRREGRHAVVVCASPAAGATRSCRATPGASRPAGEDARCMPIRRRIVGVCEPAWHHSSSNRSLFCASSKTPQLLQLLVIV
jgi:hypothetical protein